ncbi:NADH:flavin oxidoreductase/NADH oxidase [Melanomma pulvis-pyrius CBS 109.77]|uniref:NADH:flavin oxidoreductase/NADH oxidase n=1 Tax=Melanomma pulvis-pyrius CBS 109.77 TaxID=1314802 RepID=A0A6A6XQD0_9PLEO|nr:NADH:flavin oxidoreductase/NADH oxidase [Melanomma pulvis-pyrius CBS 109.77]
MSAKPLSQPYPTGTPLPTTSTLPTLFTPLKIRSLTLPNRIIVAPMGMYSAPHNGHLSPFHLPHVTQFALRGAALTIMEATAVLAAGRTSPLDAGLYLDSHIAGMKEVVDAVHALGQKIGIQLNHAGRKASGMPLERGMDARIANKEEGGWPEEVVGASKLRWQEGYVEPREMEEGDFEEVVTGFVRAAERAVEAGFDVIEIHAAHGYLLSSFLSPSSNTRPDKYGGSFANRTRLLLRIITSLRSAIPATMPLFVRISATDWMTHTPSAPQWTLTDSINLAHELDGLGVDLLDVSSGSNNLLQQIPPHAEYQIDLASSIRSSLRGAGKTMLVGAVGRIDNALIARDTVQLNAAGDAKADAALVGRQFLRDPSFVLNVAEALGVEVQWPSQYWRAAPLVGKVSERDAKRVY